MYIALLSLPLGLTATSAMAAPPSVLPGSADIDRVDPLRDSLPSEKLAIPPPAETGLLPMSNPPAGAEKIKLVLRDVKIEGATVYDQSTLNATYAELLDREITLNQVWDIAARITALYRNDGYFLSRAYVPPQESGDGRIVIKVTEGYIKEVSINKEIGRNRIVDDIIQVIKKERPLRLKTLERQHLLLGDLPGLAQYEGTLAPLKDAPEGAVSLVFAPRETHAKNSFVEFNNHGSRYLGPYQVLGGWQGSIIPMQQTSISGATSVPLQELNTVSVEHQVPLLQDLKLKVSAGYTRASPGYDLEPQDIDSKAINAGVSLNYQVIRQRRENLELNLALDARNSESTILDTPLSEDRIRAVRVGANGDWLDDWQGYNTGRVTISRGLTGLGASSEDDINISRDGAEPDFAKVEIEYRRLQRITDTWMGQFTVSGQKASGSLYSSEEFGYGGAGLGRAYDPSEISGDDGVAAGVELHYQGLPVWKETSFTPFAFYDIGKVWNHNDGQEDTISASSAGLGLSVQHESGITGTLQVALPLTKPIDTPLYGGNGENARVTFRLGYAF